MNQHESHIYTSTHHGSKLYIHFPKGLPQNITDCAKSVRAIEVQKDGETIMTIEDLGVELYERTGEFHSNLRYFAMNELVFCGDFVFIATVETSQPYWNDSIDYDQITALYIIDLPKKGTIVNVNQSHKYPNEIPALPQPPANLIRNNGFISLPKGLHTQLYRYLDILAEIRKTKKYELFSPYGEYREGIYSLSPPKALDSCKGAARIHYTENEYRWIFADKDGLYTWATLKDRLDTTNHRDDWNTLKINYLDGATALELQTVKNHFLSIGDEEITKDVLATLASLN